jgi:hypothetical protein
MDNEEIVNELEKLHNDVNVARAIVTLLQLQDSNGPSVYDYAYNEVIDKLFTCSETLYNLMESIEYEYTDTEDDDVWDTEVPSEWTYDGEVELALQDTDREKAGC